jgi:hypothetical protein
MEENRKLLEERIKSFISESQFFCDIMSNLNNEKCELTIKIQPSKGIVVKIRPNIPHWEVKFAASHPNTGGVYSVKFADGGKGMVNIKTDNTFSPWCKLTDSYKDKVFLTFDDAVEALYASIKEYGNPDYTNK